MREDSGQMMLINAFLLAIAIVTITLMLNNVIYSSNMAYAGFMDQSRYDDISLKDATMQEAAYADSMPAGYDYTKHMEDYGEAINYLISLKGRYVELTSTKNPAPVWDPALLITPETTTMMTIYGNDAKVSYVLYTGDDTVTVPDPPPAPCGPVAKVELYESKASMMSSPAGALNDYVIVRAVVMDASGNPIPNKAVDFNLISRTNSAGLPDYEFINLDLSTPPPPPPTDSSGEVSMAYIDKENTAGIATITASVEGITSSQIQISVTPPVCTTHDIALGTPIIQSTGSSGKYTILLPVDFTGFTDGNVKTGILSEVSSNIVVKTPPVFYTYYGATPNVIVTEVQLLDKDDLNMYTLKLTFEATATCTQCSPSRPYDKIVSITIRRDRVLQDVSFTPPP